MPKAPSRYDVIIEHLFLRHYSDQSSDSFEFSREDFVSVAAELGIKLPKNIGDVIYSYRYRKELPTTVRQVAREGYRWIIEGAGIARYRFRQARTSRILPNEFLATIKIPDATPEIITAYAQTDEQALLAKVRYNRLIDIFLGITAYPLQNHLRTTVKEIGQIEIDEIYIGLDRYGRQFVIPVQAKGGSDQHGVVQTHQDIACCQEKFPQLICRAVSAQFLADGKIALFELSLEQDEIKIVEERHYQLVPSSDISADDLTRYQHRAH